MQWRAAGNPGRRKRASRGRGRIQEIPQSIRVQTWPMGHAMFEYDHSGLHSIA